MPSPPNVLDAAVFQDLVESLQNITAVAAVYRKFVENAAAFIHDLRNHDAAVRSETLHTLKGSAAMMGAKRMAELAARFEEQGAAVQVEAATRQLADELAMFRSEIVSRLRALGLSESF